MSNGAGTTDIREYQDEFETASFGGDEISTTRRPDAVSFSYLRAFSLGPVALGDDSEGHDNWKWYARADADNIYLARRNVGNTGWDAESILWANYPGAPFLSVVDELSLAFTEDGYPVVAMERGGDVWFIWYNIIFPMYQLTQLGPGRTPRVVLDKFASIPGKCGPPAYVQLVYIHPTNGVVRRSWDDDFATDLDVADASFGMNDYLEKFFPTAGRRLSILSSLRDTVAGRYSFKRTDTEPYAEDVLKRPRFLISAPGDLLFNQGEEFRSPTGSIITTNDMVARAETFDDVDGIICQATTTDFSEATGWSEQVQDSIIDFPAGRPSGSTYDFTFDVLHGMGTMSPRAFRIKTYKEINGVTCYSSWMYYFAGRQAGNLVITDLGLVGNTRSIDVSSTDGQIHGIYWNGTAYVEGMFGNQVFQVEEQLDINSIPRAAYRFGARNIDHFTFTDDRGDSYDFDLYSKISNSGAGTSPVFPPDFTPPPDPQFPYTFPPAVIVYDEAIGFPGWDNVSAGEAAPSLPLPTPYVGSYHDPAPFSGTELDTLETIELEFDGGSVDVRASVETLEALLAQDELYGAALLDRLEIPASIIRDRESCPVALPRFPDDTPQEFVSDDVEGCCVAIGDDGDLEFILDGRFLLDGSHTWGS